MAAFWLVPAVVGGAYLHHHHQHHPRLSYVLAPPGDIAIARSILTSVAFASFGLAWLRSVL